MIEDAYQAAKLLFVTAEKVPVAVRAMRIFLEHVVSGESVKESLLKTSEILALEALI